MLPKSAAEFYEGQKNLNLLTNSEENFLIVNDTLTNTVMFLTVTNLKFLSTLILLSANQTFYSCPKFFTQVFTVHGVNHNVYVTLVFFSLSNKRTNSYVQAFTFLKRESNKLLLSCVPKSILLDFKLAIYQTVRIILPTTVIRRCRFHSGRTWWRKFEELGLAVEYTKKNSEFGTCLKLFFRLPFLKAHEVEECFIEDFMSVMPQNSRVEKLCNYMLNNYIVRDALMPLNIRAKFSSCIGHTTNNR